MFILKQKACILLLLFLYNYEESWSPSLSVWMVYKYMQILSFFFQEMARIHPCIPSSSSSSSFCSNEREAYTIWMKSLVLNSNGYTVYNSKADVVFRIDNYDNKRSNEVYLMDLRGNVVCTILRKVNECFHNNQAKKSYTMFLIYHVK